MGCYYRWVYRSGLHVRVFLFSIVQATCTIAIIWYYFADFPVHDDVIKWKHFSRYWPFNCEGHSPITGEFPSQRPVTWSFDVLFDLRLNKRLSKLSIRRWFDAPSRPLWRHCNAFFVGVPGRAPQNGVPNRRLSMELCSGEVWSQPDRRHHGVRHSAMSFIARDPFHKELMSSE